MKLKRVELRKVLGLLTEHCSFRKHLPIGLLKNWKAYGRSMNADLVTKLKKLRTTVSLNVKLFPEEDMNYLVQSI